MHRLVKYPRTHHIEGSRLQPGDEDLESIPFATLAGRNLVVEEKLDGANSGLRFDENGQLWLQSRGHFLRGGPRERHFNLLKTWAHCHQTAFWNRLGPRYVVYGEWLYARHTIYYDLLPHYFMEFDVLDLKEETFLSTPRRRELLQGLPLQSVPVLSEGPVPSLKTLQHLVRRALYKSDHWKESLRDECQRQDVNEQRAMRETDRSDLAEGLYIKLEEDGQVKGRYKFIRKSFLTAVLESGSHWLTRPIVPNRLREGVDIFAPLLS